MNSNDHSASERVRSVRPRTDVFETDQALVLLADLPGVDEGAVELTLTDDVLGLRARPSTTAPEGWRALGPTVEAHEFERRFQLATEIDRDGIEAELRDGRLRVTLKKRQPRSSTIAVRGS